MLNRPGWQNPVHGRRWERGWTRRQKKKYQSVTGPVQLASDSEQIAMGSRSLLLLPCWTMCVQWDFNSYVISKVYYWLFVSSLIFISLYNIVRSDLCAGFQSPHQPSLNKMCNDAEEDELSGATECEWQNRKHLYNTLYQRIFLHLLCRNGMQGGNMHLKSHSVMILYIPFWPFHQHNAS